MSGINDMFLTKSEKENIRKWTYSVVDESSVTKIFTPFWNWLTTLIPDTVAPNILSLVGLFCILYAWHISNNYLGDYPRTVSIASVLLVFTYMNLDAIDGKHARKIGNQSPLGELFDHSCDNIGLVFMILTFCYNMDITNLYIQWYLVQTAQLLFLDSHITAFKSRVVKFGKYTGPGEALLLYMGLIIMNAFGLLNFVPYILNFIAYLFGYTLNEFATKTLITIYCCTLAYLVINVLRIEKHYSTKTGLLLSIGISIVPSILIYMGLQSDVNEFTVMSHGLVMAILTGDMIISKMANRDLHAWIPALMMTSLFSNFFCVIACIFYYTAILTELSFSLKVPLFTVQRIVYCSGVFDFCHGGHKKMFENSAELGSKLLVGVHSDTDVESYKRLPAMTQEERLNEVIRCKYVDQVIPNAPLYLTEDFIKKHNIHLVVCSVEYDSPTDKYYEVPRKMGILHVLPRTDGISTTDLMKRVVENKKSEDLGANENKKIILIY
jgi:cytidyltransferase-like protein